MDLTNNNRTRTPVCVLVVDDDPLFSKAVQASLQLYKKHTFEVILKDSIESAISEINHNNKINIIITDYYFPSSNGLELCLQLNQMDRQIPIIFLTNATDFKLAVEAMKLGVEDFLLKKDFDTAHLPRAILTILGSVRLRMHKQAVEKRLSMAENRDQAIRELVVTVCHEFNNPLAAIKISFDLLTRNNRNIIPVDISKSFENNFNKIDLEIKRLRDLNFEKIEFTAHDIFGGNEKIES